MKIRKNIFWGLAFILAAIALVVKKLGYLQGVGIWSILFSAILAVIFVKGIIKRRWATILFSAAFFIIVNDELLRLESLTPWTVLGVALLGTIGLNMIFSKGVIGPIRVHSSKENEWNESDDLILSADGETVNYDVVCGNSVKYIKSQQLSHVNADCVCGEVSIYLTETALQNHRASMSIDVVCGHANVYVPAGWSVSTNMDTVCGNVAFLGTGEPSGEDILVINGDVVFGDLRIYYV